MPDVVRCSCPKDAKGTRCGRNPGCPIHGVSGADPYKPWVLTEDDRALLISMRISPTDPK